MGDAAVALGVDEEMVVPAPLEGGFADEAVVGAVEMPDEVVAHVERELATRGGVQLGAEALGVDAVKLRVHRGHFGVETGGAVFGEVGDRFDEVGVRVAELAGAGVVGGRDRFLKLFGRFVKQVFGKFAAAVRRVDGRERGDVGRHAEHGDAVSCVETALAVGDDVDLLGAGLLDGLYDGFLDLERAGLDVAGRFLAAVIDRRAVLDELGGDPAPVVQMLRVSEENAVHHEQRVLRLADLPVLALFVPPVPLALFADFPARGLYDDAQREKIRHGDHAAERAQKPLADAELVCREVNEDDARPEERVHQKERDDRENDYRAPASDVVVEDQREDEYRYDDEQRERENSQDAGAVIAALEPCVRDAAGAPERQQKCQRGEAQRQRNKPQACLI